MGRGLRGKERVNLVGRKRAVGLVKPFALSFLTPQVASSGMLVPLSTTGLLHASKVGA